METETGHESLLAVTDLSGLLAADDQLRQAVSAWPTLTPQQRRDTNRKLWLLNEKRQRAKQQHDRQVRESRQNGYRSYRARQNAQQAQRVQDETCPQCFLVRTPTARCNCTEG